MQSCLEAMSSEVTWYRRLKNSELSLIVHFLYGKRRSQSRLCLEFPLCRLSKFCDDAYSLLKLSGEAHTRPTAYRLCLNEYIDTFVYRASRDDTHLPPDLQCAD